MSNEGVEIRTGEPCIENDLGVFKSRNIISAIEHVVRESQGEEDESSTAVPSASLGLRSGAGRGVGVVGEGRPARMGYPPPSPFGEESVPCSRA